MNEYSPLWFKTFLETIPDEQTEKETAFVARWLQPPTYATVLDIQQITEKLRTSGRFILDIFHRGFFESHQGVWTLERGGRTVIERKWMSGNRLTVELDYGDGCVTDHFERRLYMPNEIIDLCSRFSLDCVLSCTEFDEAKPVTAENPRMQIVFEKR